MENPMQPDQYPECQGSSVRSGEALPGFRIKLSDQQISVAQQVHG
jgi:hypothetical protein